MVAEVREPRHVGGSHVDRRLVHLEIARMDHHPNGCLDREGGGVRDAVGDVNELRFEGAQFDDVTGLHLSQVRLLDEFVLAQLVLDETERQPAAVDRRIDFGKDVGQRADMVFVAVGQEEAEDFLLALRQVGHIRQHQVDAEHLLFGEHQAGIDDDDVFVVLQGHHVASDLAQSPERDGTQTGSFSQKG